MMGGKQGSAGVSGCQGRGWVLGLAVLMCSVVTPVQAAQTPCKATAFETRQYAEACKKGQKEAKRQALRFIKNVIKAKRRGGNPNFHIGCDACHATRDPDYQTKPDALEQYRRYAEFAGIR